MEIILPDKQSIFSKKSIASFYQSILKTLAYFDLFRYPLTEDEIMSFLDQPIGKNELKSNLNILVLSKKIFKLDEFYSLQNDKLLVERRRKGNARASYLLKKAETIVKRLYKFPYVRAIGISGSVSKNFADENADIDYFIITKANRLWIAKVMDISLSFGSILKYF